MMINNLRTAKNGGFLLSKLKLRKERTKEKNIY